MAEPVVRFLKSGQPVIRTARGPRFGFKTQASGPFEGMGQRIVAGAADGLAAVAIRIMEESLIQCPVETGTLKRSARYEMAEEVTGKVEVRLGYGYGEEINPITRRPASDYAVPVHEILEAYHEPPTKAKFLEDPLLEHASEIEPYLASTIKASILATGKGAPSETRIASGAELAFERISGPVQGFGG